MSLQRRNVYADVNKQACFNTDVAFILILKKGVIAQCFGSLPFIRASGVRNQGKCHSLYGVMCISGNKYKLLNKNIARKPACLLRHISPQCPQRSSCGT